MTAATAPLTDEELTRLTAVAEVLAPGLPPSPPASALPDYRDLLQRAAVAIGPEIDALRKAIAALPPAIDWAGLQSWSAEHDPDFEIVSTVVAGAYFMSPDVLRSIGYRTEQRRPAPIDTIADELGDGLLDDVVARGPVYREVPLP